MIRGREGAAGRPDNVIPMREPPPFVPPRVKRGMGTEEEPATAQEIINRAARDGPEGPPEAPCHDRGRSLAV